MKFQFWPSRGKSLGTPDLNVCWVASNWQAIPDPFMLFHSAQIKIPTILYTNTFSLLHPFSALLLLSQTLRPHLVLLPNPSPPLAPPPSSSLVQSRLAPHVAGLLTGLGPGNDASPYVCAAAAVLNREDKCGILNIRIIVSLPLSAVLCGRQRRETLPMDLSVHN